MLLAPPPQGSGPIPDVCLLPTCSHLRAWEGSPSPQMSELPVLPLLLPESPPGLIRPVPALMAKLIFRWLPTALMKTKLSVPSVVLLTIRDPSTFPTHLRSPPAPLPGFLLQTLCLVGSNASSP